MNKTSICAALLIYVMISISCGLVLRSSGGSASISSDIKKGELIEDGVASWYGPNFHGKLTANGEVYDMDGLTAAHRTLPFNTEVLVENLDNGKKILVRINDRGPFAKDRIIDLSREAAKQIEMIGPGTANVKLFLVKGDLANSRVTDLKVANYTVQLGSYVDKEPAERRSGEIDGSRVETLTLDGQTIYRVYFGLYQDPDEAQKALLKLESKGFQGFVKQVEND